MHIYPILPQKFHKFVLIHHQFFVLFLKMIDSALISAFENG